MAKILILVHEYDIFQFRRWSVGRQTSRYYLFDIIPRLRERKHEVLVSSGVPEEHVSADALLMHVDATVVPNEYADYAKRFPIGINTRVTDISKRRISGAVLDRSDRWQGSVIVKSNLNDKGYPERRLNKRARARGAPTPFPAPSSGDVYEIFDSIDDVPEPVFANSGLVVEKFVAEREIDGYAIRFWTFCGDRERCTRYVSAGKILKASNVIRSEPVPVPDELREMRRTMGFDYGKFDFVVHEEAVVLLDANKTPGRPRGLRNTLLPEAHRLALGVESLLARH